FLYAKWQFWAFPVFETWNKSRCCSCPICINGSKFLSQKLLFGKHNALIIYPVQKGKSHAKPHILRKHTYAQPHKKVAYIKWVPYGRINASSVYLISHLAFGSIAA